MIIFLSVISFVYVFIVVFTNQPKFGRKPGGERLERIKKSPNYRDGAFQNLHHTPALAEGTGYFEVLTEFLFKKKERISPVDQIPSLKTDLLKLEKDTDCLVWFGHSSYFMQFNGKKILVDPVFSGSASPLPFGTRSFKGTDIYTTDEMPHIDYLFLTHDHWDHLDFDTIKKLKPKIKQVICSLGTGEHLEYWGYDKSLIIEKDWNETIPLENGFTVYTTPARHFSGRTFTRNKALWTSFVLKTPDYNIYLGGDSGYDTHFAEIGRQFGPFDLAILENGQYDKNWRYIHMLPDEIMIAAKELQTAKLFPVHSSKFALANHPWDEPLKKIKENSKGVDIQLLTPRIGEALYFKNKDQKFTAWWEGVN